MPGRSTPCLAALHDACTRRGLPCACPCHPLAEAAGRASGEGLTYTATLDPDGTVAVRCVAAGVVTALRFGDPHEALGFLDAEGAGPHPHTCPHGGTPVTYPHDAPGCLDADVRPHPWCHPR